MEVDDHSGRFKRLLPTTISSPDRSPQARKGKKATRQKSSAKKSLSFKDVSSSVVNTDSHHNEMSSSNTADDSPQAVGELFLSYLNVEDLLESSSTEAKVVIVNPGGRVETFSSFHDKTKSIMVNLCRKKWKTVANLLPPQSPRGFSALARLYYLATKTAMLRRLPFVKFKHFDKRNLYLKQQNCPCLRNWNAKLNCERRIIAESR